MAKPMKGVSYINRKGIQYWYAWLNGHKVYCGKGEKGQEMAEAARSKEVARKYENREARAGLKVKKASFKTVKELSNWYMTKVPSVQEKKAYVRKISSAAHLLEHLGGKPVNDIEGDDQERYREKRKAEGAAEGTIDYEISLLRAMYRLALKRKKIQPTMMPGEFVQKNDRNPRRIISDSEFEKLLEHTDPDFGDVLICGYESAMRSSEISNLRASQVHLDVRHIHGAIIDYIDLGIFDTKTKTKRTVPVGPRLKEVLKRRLKNLEPDDHVFTYKRHERTRTYDPNMICFKMGQTCDKAALPYGDKALKEKGERIGIVFHCLRHTRTTKWVEMGFSDEIIRRATGHRSLDAYQQYVKLDPAVVMRLVEEKADNSGIKTAESLYS